MPIPSGNETGNPSMVERLPKGLYVLTPESADDDRLVAVVDAALRGGASTVQYRSKTLAPNERQRQAMRLRDVCQEAGAIFLVNDSLELAAQVRADGIHLGRDDATPAEARALLGRDAIVGVSCYDSFELALRTRDEADYCAFGSVFPSQVKPSAVTAPLGLFGQAREAGLHAVAIGGIDVDNAGKTARAGAAAMAVITAVFGAASSPASPELVEANARRLLAAFESARGA